MKPWRVAFILVGFKILTYNYTTLSVVQFVSCTALWRKRPSVSTFLTHPPWRGQKVIATPAPHLIKPSWALKLVSRCCRWVLPVCHLWRGGVKIEVEVSWLWWLWRCEYWLCDVKSCCPVLWSIKVPSLILPDTLLMWECMWWVPLGLDWWGGSWPMGVKPWGSSGDLLFLNATLSLSSLVFELSMIGAAVHGNMCHRKGEVGLSVYTFMEQEAWCSGNISIS